MLGLVEEARVDPCLFVAEHSKPNDVDAMMEALEFLHRQVRKAHQRMDVKMAGLVRLAKGR